ncbi:MAG: acyl-CoA dehydrogenase [Saprospiraceae bacterium]
MSVQPNSQLPFSPAVRLFIPLLYAAWSDRVLSPSEVLTIQEEAFKFDFLSDFDKAQLQEWANPKRFPPRDLYKMWEIHCRQAADQLKKPDDRTLIHIGIALANQPDAPWNSEPIRGQLIRMEKTLGAINEATFQTLFSTPASIRDTKEKSNASFEIKAMQELLDGQYVDLKSKMRSLLSDPVFTLDIIPDKHDYRTKILGWLHMLASQGLGALSYPEAYGGKDDMGIYGAAFEMLGYHDLSLTIKFGVQFGLWGGAVLALGTNKHHEKYLKAIGDLSLPGCFAMTETGHGSNVRGLETTAIYQREKGTFIINTPHPDAGKEYIGNALHGQMGAVFAQLIIDGENHGVHAFIVRLRDGQGQTLEGIRIEDNGYKLGLNGVDNGRIWFDQVEIPRENLLDRFGQVDENGNYHSAIKNPSKRFFMMLGTLVGGRVCVPRAGLSAAKKGLAIAVRYATRRRQFAPGPNQPETLIMDYPSHQRRLIPLVAKAYALSFALDDLLERFVHNGEEDFREVETLAAGMKSYATWFTTESLQECREACGGKGYLAENQFAALKADSDIFTTFEGDNTVLMQLVAKGVLSQFKQAFHEEGNMAVLRILTQRITVAINEQNPLIIRNTDSSHLRGQDFQLNAFRYREQRLLTSLANRLRGLIKSGKSAHEAGLLAQTHLLKLADAFIEKVVLESFITKENALEDANLKEVLGQLRAMYALTCIEKHGAWYLEQDYIANVKSKAIRKSIDQLCAELRPEVLALVESFGIPDALLAAPIAM